MQLIYRGQTFDYTPVSARVVRVPRGVNWRYQVEGENYDRVSRFFVLRAHPVAINWRYQAIVER